MKMPLTAEKERCMSETRKIYGLPENMDSMGRVVDPETNIELIIGASIHRDLYQKTGYVCSEYAPEEFHVCICSLLEQIQGMAIIKTILLTPENVYAPICGEHEPTKEMVRYSQMAICALREVLKGILYEQEA